MEYWFKTNLSLLNSLVKEINKNKCVSIKKDWTETFTNILYPILINPEILTKNKMIRLQYLIKELILKNIAIRIQESSFFCTVIDPTEVFSEILDFLCF